MMSVCRGPCAQGIYMTQILQDTRVLIPLSRMTLTSRSNKFIFENRIVIQLDIHMYIGVRKFLPLVRNS